MIERTAHQIEGDFYDMIGRTSLITGTQSVAGIGGHLYRFGLRPRDSRAEDCIVSFITCNAAQFPEGIVSVNVLVPDILPYKNGVSVEDGRRCEEIEGLALASFKEMKAMCSNYHLTLRETIHTSRDESINQSAVVMAIQFKYYNND